MKPASLLLLASLGTNAVLLGVFSFRPSLAPAALREYFGRGEILFAREPRHQTPAERAAKKARESEMLRRESEVVRAAESQAQFWSALQPDDLPGLVARLRAAGFPPSVIRAIVSAQVQARFAARMSALAATVENVPYWKPAPTNSYSNPKYEEEYEQIYRERTRLMHELLGDDFLSPALGDPTAYQRRRFGDLAKGKIDQVQRLEDDYAEMISQVRAGTRGITLPEDRGKLAMLEREKQADLAALLTPAELEDYKMRSSPTTDRLRTTMTWMNATETEFRTIYALNQSYADRIDPSGENPFMWEEVSAATKALNAELKTALGEARFADYARSSSYEFQNLARLAQREGLPTAAAIRAYDLRDPTTKESVRIADDKNLTYEEKLSALKALVQNTRTQLTATLGANVATSYTSSLRWLQAIENGRAVTFATDNSTTYRPIQPPRMEKKP